MADDEKPTWVRAFRYLPAVLVVGFVAWCSQGSNRRAEQTPVKTELAELFQSEGLVDGPVHDGDLAKAAKRAGQPGMNRLLYNASAGASLPALKWMVANGADAKNVGTLEDLPLLMRAAKRPQFERLDYLISLGLDPAERSRAGLSLMHVAAQNGMDERVLALLLSKGLTLADATPAQRRPIHYASIKSIGVLAKAGADLNVLDSDGRSALHWAAAEGRGDAVSELIRMNASVFSSDRQGRTPLHLAAVSRCEPCIDALLAAGAPRAARDQDGRSPRELAEAEQRNRARSSREPLLDKL